MLVRKILPLPIRTTIRRPLNYSPQTVDIGAPRNGRGYISHIQFEEDCENRKSSCAPSRSLESKKRSDAKLGPCDAGLVRRKPPELVDPPSQLLSRPMPIPTMALPSQSTSVTIGYDAWLGRRK